MSEQNVETRLANDLMIPEARVISGEFHNHTCVSPDVSEAYMCFTNILNVAFRENLAELPEQADFCADDESGFDFFMTADHFRSSIRDPDCRYRVSTIYRAIVEQIGKYNSLKAQAKYKGKAYYPGFEWDMPGFDHATVALITDGVQVPVDGIRAFEWLYSSLTDTALFNKQEEEFGPRLNESGKDKEKTFEALAWIKAHYPNSFFSLNHPSAKKGTSREIKIEDIRRLHDLAPEIFFSFEGLPGNQLSGDRGEYPAVYGGADIMAAKVGGIWDALLAEGRRIFILGNSDFHFKLSSNALYSSGYWPSEYAKNYFLAQGENFLDIVSSLRQGNAFTVLGNLITALEFSAQVETPEKCEKKSVHMGGELQVEAGSSVELIIRFKEGQINNYQDIEYKAESAIKRKNTGEEAEQSEKSEQSEKADDFYALKHPKLHHLDLIVGRMTGKADDYTSDTNPTAKVLKRFYREHFSEPDAEGFREIKFITSLEESCYFRLRGTNLPPGTPGYTDADGNPLKDKELIKSNYKNRRYFFNLINKRNYRSLWFYSNPIFIKASL